MVAKEEREAIQLELKDLKQSGLSQSKIALRIGLTQGAVNKAMNRAELGRDFALAFHKAFGEGRSPEANARHLIRFHKTGGPAKHDDMVVAEFMSWLNDTPALKQLAKDRSISVLDLLRVHRTPPRHGFAGKTGEKIGQELKRHIEQLRIGEIGDLPGADVPADAIEAELRRHRM